MSSFKRRIQPAAGLRLSVAAFLLLILGVSPAASEGKQIPADELRQLIEGKLVVFVNSRGFLSEVTYGSDGSASFRTSDNKFRSNGRWTINEKAELCLTGFSPPLRSGDSCTPYFREADGSITYAGGGVVREIKSP